MKIQRNSKGFTLIELLIVVAIIGILAAIAIPNYMNYTRRAKMGEVIHAMGAIKNAVSVYYSEAGSTVAATDGAAIRTAYGVDVPEGKATFAYSGGVITASPTIGGVTGNVTLTTTDYKSWTWAGSVESSFIPKN